MSPERDIPVLIVGAGPTGLLAANLLASYGIQSVVIDKATEQYQLPRAILLDDEGFRSLQAVGLADAMRARVLWNYGARYYADDGTCFAKIEPRLAEYGFPRRNSFHQPELETVLEDAALGTGRVEIMRGMQLISFTQTEGHVEADLAGTDGGAFRWRCRFLLGCDGARSTVRDVLGARMEGQTFTQDWVVVDTKNDPDRDHFSKFFCSVERPSVSIPAPRGGRRYEFMVMPGDDPERIATPGAVQALLARHRSFESSDIVKAAIYTFNARIASRLVENRVALLGDAAPSDAALRRPGHECRSARRP